jgi:hypothetical protein
MENIRITSSMVAKNVGTIGNRVVNEGEKVVKTHTKSNRQNINSSTELEDRRNITKKK